MIKQPNWWKNNDKTTKMGEKKPIVVVCEKIFFFFFQLERIWKKLVKQNDKTTNSQFGEKWMIRQPNWV